MKALVLCGGEGKRLRPLTYYFQKTMIPIGVRQKPLLEYIVRLLRHHHINDITLLVGYKAEQITNYFEDGSRFNVNVSYSEDVHELKGTGGSLLNAYNNGFIDEEDQVIIYYGDILSSINLTELIKQHINNGAMTTVALAQGYELPVGVAQMSNDQRITGFIEKPSYEKPVSIGILAIKGVALRHLKELPSTHEGLDIMRHLIPSLIEKGEPVYGYILDSFWYDVGTTERYEKLENGRIEKIFNFLLFE